MTQIGFSRSEAHEALDQFLNDTDLEHDGTGMSRWIAEGDMPRDQRTPVKAIAHIVSDKTYRQLQEGYQNWMESEEWKRETNDLPPGYRPWIYSPLANTDRMLPIEPLLETLSRIVHRKPLADLTADERTLLRGHAILLVLKVQLDPDGQGAVPILRLGHDDDEPGNGMRWQMAFVTEVPGLYVRVTSNGFFGEEWGIVTGSGYQMASGWHSREGAATCVYALGRVLPNAEWMQLTPRSFTKDAVAAITAAIKRYGPYSRTDSAEPDPDPVTSAQPPVEADEATA